MSLALPSPAAAQEWTDVQKEVWSVIVDCESTPLPFLSNWSAAAHSAVNAVTGSTLVTR